MAFLPPIPPTPPSPPPPHPTPPTQVHFDLKSPNILLAR